MPFWRERKGENTHERKSRFELTVALAEYLASYLSYSSKGEKEQGPS